MLVMVSLFEQAWFQPVLEAVGIALAGIVGYLAILAQSWIKKKIKNEKLRALAEVVLNLVRTAVLSTQQTFVDDLKKDGKFDKEKQKEALELTISKVKAGLTEETRTFLSEVYPDVEAWIRDQVEATIKTIK